MAFPMKKAYYYSFMPSKQEEMAALATNRPYQVTRTLIEIRDDAPLPNLYDQSNPWRIRKRLESHEIVTGKIHLSHDDVFDHIFRYFTLENADLVVTGNKRLGVAICDVTDGSAKHRPYDDDTFFAKEGQDEYVLVLNMAMVRSYGFKKGDEIGIYYDPRTSIFYFKAFR